MVIKYLKPGATKALTLVGVASITLNSANQFVCVMNSGSEVHIPKEQFIECK